MMQDTLASLLQRNLIQLYLNYMQRIPLEVTVTATNSVENTSNNISSPHKAIEFLGELNLDYILKQNISWSPQTKPIFITEISYTIKEDDYCFLYAPQNLASTLLGDFEKVLKDLSQIPDPEPRLRDNYYKFQNNSNIRTPQQIIESNEDRWLSDLYNQLSLQLQLSIEPMN